MPRCCRASGRVSLPFASRACPRVAQRTACFPHAWGSQPCSAAELFEGRKSEPVSPWHACCVARPFVCAVQQRAATTMPKRGVRGKVERLGRSAHRIRMCTHAGRCYGHGLHKGICLAMRGSTAHPSCVGRRFPVASDIWFRALVHLLDQPLCAKRMVSSGRNIYLHRALAHHPTTSPAQLLCTASSW